MEARGHQIRRQREKCGYGLTAFAELIGISPAWLSRIERNQGKPSPDVLRRIALAIQRERVARDAIAAITDEEDEGSDEHQFDG
ncbi:helix-turn-helix domain-containing protein [Streptomyces sp. NPDC001268]|uniref:helix-turn-helix domain-containing protein n=1 Tax=Streptomyces sp. NPDC001268 TaxID=3364553 RepID=UPI0036B922F8